MSSVRVGWFGIILSIVVEGAFVAGQVGLVNGFMTSAGVG